MPTSSGPVTGAIPSPLTSRRRRDHQQAVGQVDPVNAGPVNFTVVFSEPVTDFTDTMSNSPAPPGRPRSP